MGVLNVTPDSFSDGGYLVSPTAAFNAAASMVESGASILDVGGESTRPGAEPVSANEEIDRVVPVIELIKGLDVIVSVDTCKTCVAAAAVDAGASMVNDVRAARDEGMVDLISCTGVGICLMHMQGFPRTMQHEPFYSDVVVEVRDFLGERVAACLEAGVEQDRILLDPGIGFGKMVDHNLRLLNNLKELSPDGLPVVVGLSRKSTIGHLTGKPVGVRLAGSIAGAVLSVVNGASVIRAHDVDETIDAMKVVEGFMENANERKG
jgi:dihydropteroate synthase